MRTPAVLLLVLLLLVGCADKDRTFFEDPTAFTKPAEPFLNVQACIDAKAGGQYPMAASCTDDLGLCPDRSATLATREEKITGTYRLDGESMTAVLGERELSGPLDSNGTFVSNSVYGVVANTVWNPTSPELVPALPGCD